MTILGRRWWALCLAAGLVACGGGGGDSTTTTISGGGLNSQILSPAVSLSANPNNPTTSTTVTTNISIAPAAAANPDPVNLDPAGLLNSLRVVVEDGPRGFQFSPNANILYATVTVCVPGDASQCKTIDHVQVDTGSVGLRVLASKVKSLNLPRVQLSATESAWECFPFVIGGMWGANAVADVGLGQQTATAVAVQLIEDDPNAPIGYTNDCYNAADRNILESASTLGSNGILGIGSTTLDCGQGCVSGNYSGSFVQYYSCPQGATSSAACAPAAVPANLQVYNPVAALPAPYNNGVLLKMPAVTNPGAATATGVLIFGVDTVANNRLPAGATKVVLGTDPVNKLASYLNVTTVHNGMTYLSSYLDTGTNGLFFTDAAIPRCAGSTWYCPGATLTLNAVISDGDDPTLNRVPVAFNVGNAEGLFSTNNTAFSDAAGTSPSTAVGAFSWGMPFFYGRRVYLSIWQMPGALNAPWYAWAPL